MKIAFNPSTVEALITPPNNKDITFDLRGHNIFARGVKFCGTDTNTWRDIKINNVSIDSNTLDLRDGDNITLTNINGVVTINSTWRPVVDNLTSDSTTSSLSANQGRILAELINGKSDSGHNHDDRYVKKTGDTMFGALNFANGTWNLVGDDSYMGDCNISGHFGIKAANTTYPGIAFFNNSGTHLGNLTAYSGNIKYGAYSLQFLDNGNTSVSASTWMNPFSDYNSNAVADGQAICVWGQSSSLSNLAADSGDMSLWLKRVNANVATLNMVLDGEYYANGNQRLAHVSEIPNSLKNPHALTISLNGTSQGPYDGSAAKNINITPGSIGAATSDHNHDSSYVKYTKVTKSTADNTNATPYLYNVENEEVISGYYKYWYIFNMGQYSGGNYGTQIAMPYENSLTDSELFIRSANSGSWRTWRRILHSNNYASILDSRYYTESEIDSLLDAKLNRQNLSYGTWNPRDYNLAADYQYNGGDLSISESGGQIHVSVDGYFWQNEGQYRVLDTSDIGSIRGSITIQQYLSNSDTNWYPLIWGGDDHRNTYTSTGGIYKSHDVLSWQTSSQTLYATHLQTTYIDLQNNRGISQVTSGGTSPYKGIRLPDLQSNGIGIFSRVGNGSDEGGIVSSEDTCVIYNSFDTGWGLSVRDKDRNQTDISGDDTIAFGVRQDYRAYSLGGFEKSGSDNSYVLLGGGGHKLESSLNVANADKVDGYHYNDFTYKKYIGYNRNGPYNIKVFSADTSSLTWGAYYLIFDIFSSGYSNNRVYFGKYEVSLGHWNNTDKNPTVYSRWIFKTNSAYDCVHVIKDLSNYTVDVYIENNLWDSSMGLSIVAIGGFNMVSSNSWVNLPSASSTVQLIGTTYLSFMGNADMLDGYHANGLLTALSNSNNGISITVGGTTKSVSNISVNYADSAGNADTLDGVHLSGIFTAFGNNNHNITATIGGVTKEFQVNYASDADKLDGYHENSFLRYRGHTNTDQEATLWNQIGIKEYYGALPDGLTDIYNWGGVISLPGIYSRFEIYAAHSASSGTGLYYRSGWDSDKKTWLKFIDSSNIGSQSVNYANSAGNADTATNAYHLRINSANTWSTWYWAGQGGQPSWLWGSNDGTNMYVWDPNNFNVNTAQYLRSLGNQNCQTGRTQNYGDVYTYNTYHGNTDSPTEYSSVIGFGRGTAGTVEIAGGWCNSHLYWRSLRDCCDDWYSWRTVLDSSNYTEFINNYYWANVKISASSSTSTSPTVHTLTATRVCAGHNPEIDNSISCSNWFRSSGATGWYNTTYQGGWYMSDTSWIRAHNNVGIYTSGQIYSPSSIRMGNILLEHTDEINNSTNGNLYLNYRNSGNVSLCQGGGSVGIGTTSPSYKLHVAGDIYTTTGFKKNGSNDSYVLLGGGGHKALSDFAMASSLNNYYWAYDNKYIKQPICLEFVTFVSYRLTNSIWSSPTYTNEGNITRLTIPNLTVPYDYDVYALVISHSAPNTYATIWSYTPLQIKITHRDSSSGYFAVMIWAIPS